MENSDNDNHTISIDALFCDAVTTDLFAEIPKSYALSANRPCEEVYKEGVLSCKHPDRDEYFEEGKGLDLKNKKVSGTYDVLPLYIPIPPRDVLSLPIMLTQSVVGVRIRDVFPSAIHDYQGSLKYSSLPSADVDLTKASLFAETTPMLFYSGPDVLIEGINREKFENAVYETVQGLGIRYATSPDFSVNEGSCVYGQLVNTNRSLAVAEEMNQYNIKSIPNVFVVHPHLLKLWVEYLNLNSSIGVISINCQRQRKKSSDMEVLIRYILKILEGVNRPIHLILHGFPITKKVYLLALKKYACQIHFADSAPFYVAVCKFHYQVYNPVVKKLIDIEEPRKDPQIRAKIIKLSILAREQYLLDVFYKGAVCRNLVLPDMALAV